MTQPPPPPPTADYAAPPAPRSLGTWITLLLVWSIGLVSWALYGVALVYLLTRIL
jgi:hypothetical protein